ncbi:Hypothetical_protein [Hexamita inflata]|uniref:Hypothetical_protein n=1 Tax=Hexamita inflata TaxID=28002 RepID=A0AA86UY48_9EUKA|nr:Hypothetical protein HINF_LOCUS64305 [Hexamita inflata]
MNFISKLEQKDNFNTTHPGVDSDLVDFIKQLSTIKQKTAACYGDGYLSLGDKFWSIISDAVLIDFVEHTYQPEPQAITIQSLLDAISKTISSTLNNENFRLYSRNIPYGSGQDNVATKMQIVIQDTEYLETPDQAIHFLEGYPEITKENQQKYQFEVLIIENTKLKNPVSKILQLQLTLSYIKLDIDQYITHQFQIIDSTESYHMLPRFIDAFGQEVIQICTKINQTAKFNVSVLCQQFPVQQLFTNKGLQYIVNTDIEQYIAKNTQIQFNYKYFLAQLQPQWYQHINQYKQSQITINNTSHIFKNINGNVRLILRMREIDTIQQSLIIPVQKTILSFQFDNCDSFSTNFVFNSQNQINVDCAYPNQAVSQIFNDQQHNIEAALLLSNNTFSQISTLKAYFQTSKISCVIGRMSGNLMSTTISDFKLDENCKQYIADLVYDYPNKEHFTTSKFNYFQKFCHYQENGIQKAENFTFLVKMHKNMFFTDYVVFPSAKISWMFGSGDFNVINQDMQTLYPSTTNHLQTLVQDGVLLCKLQDECDGLVKRLRFGNTSALKSDNFRQLENVNGIIFKVISQPNITFNCTTQKFNNDLMKDSQMRAEYFQNGFQETSKIKAVTVTSQQHMVFALVIIICVLLNRILKIF